MKDYVYKKGGHYAVLVSGEGCANCELLKFSLLKALEENSKFSAYYLEAEDDKDEIISLGIEKVPCIILFSLGKELARCYGYQPDEILSLWIEAKSN